MTKNELREATAIAQDNNATLLDEDISLFDGFGLPGFQVVHVTVRQVAALIRWQAQYLTGGFDAEALNEVATLGRKRFMVIA